MYTFQSRTLDSEHAHAYSEEIIINNRVNKNIRARDHVSRIIYKYLGYIALFSSVENIDERSRVRNMESKEMRNSFVRWSENDCVLSSLDLIY